MSLLKTMPVPALMVLLTSCMASDPDTAPMETADDVAAMPAIEGSPQRLCYFLESETLTSGMRLTLAPGSAVLGETYGTIHHEEGGYFAFYTQTHEGTVSGTAISVTTETLIEGDLQIEQQSWTLMPDRLVRQYETYPAVACETVDARFAGLSS